MSDTTNIFDSTSDIATSDESSDQAVPISYETMERSVTGPTPAVTAKETPGESARPAPPPSAPVPSRAQTALEVKRREQALAQRERRVAEHEALFLSEEQRTQLTVQENARDASRYVREHAESYPLLNQLGLQDRVAAYQAKVYYETHGQKLATHAEVADALEAYCEQVVERGHQAVKQARGTPAWSRRLPAARDGVSSANDNRPLSDDERYRRALQVMELAAARRDK